MARKYSRILQAAKYYSAIDNYIKYITDASKRGQNVGEGKARAASKILFIEPFGVKLGTDVEAQVSGASTTWGQRQAIFALHTKDTIANTVTPVKLDGFRAARAVITTGRSTTGTRKVSKVTGMAYLDYKGTSTSLPFGRKNATETQAEAFDELKTALISAIPGALVTLQPEKL
jgi:hypothetical protein